MLVLSSPVWEEARTPLLAAKMELVSMIVF